MKNFAKQLLGRYPIQPIPKASQGYFSKKHISKFSLFQSFFSLPIRSYAAKLASTLLLNNRFEEDYFPLQFKIGAFAALESFFSTLDGWDGSPGKKYSHLESILTPELFRVYQNAHESFDKAGLVLNLKWVHEEDLELGLVWFSFGSSNCATSTLLEGPIEHNYSAISNCRLVKQNAKSPERRIFREFCFEHVFKASEIECDDDGIPIVPDAATKRENMSLGQCAAVDVTIPSKLLVQIQSKDNSNESENSKIMYLFTDVGLHARLETNHFKKNTENVEWKIADIENYLIAPRLEEELKSYTVNRKIKHI